MYQYVRAKESFSKMKSLHSEHFHYILKLPLTFLCHIQFFSAALANMKCAKPI